MGLCSLYPRRAAPLLEARGSLASRSTSSREKLTAQLGISEFSDCKARHENAQVRGMTELEKLGNPNLGGKLFRGLAPSLGPKYTASAAGVKVPAPGARICTLY